MTIALLVLPVLLSALVGAYAPALARTLPPALAVPLLTALGLLAALATGLSLSVLGLFWVGQLPWVAAHGQWSADFLRGVQPVPTMVQTLGGLAALVLLLIGLRQLVHGLGVLWSVERDGRRLGGTGRLVVVDDAVPDAYALPGLRGRIVVSSAMLQALPASGRRVLLAHEGAHLRYRHDLYQLLTRLAVAANPLLRPLRGAVALGAERWADEVAAELTGDRELVARTLARAGLARAGHRTDRAALALAETELAARTHALLQPAPQRSWWRCTGLAVGLVLLAATGIGLSVWTQHLFELAELAMSR